MKRMFLLWAFLLGLHSAACAQGNPALDSAVQRVAAEKDPQKTVTLLNGVIRTYGLKAPGDAETIDALYGTAAVRFALAGNYPQFEKYIALIRNPFNQTSFMNMAAGQILQEGKDAAWAHTLSKRTLDRYHAFKGDTSARPAGFAKKDWERFMDFAQYPYYDTYAQSLYALKKWDEALVQQKKAFAGPPEEGVPSAVQRYAKLLELTGQKAEARALLLRMAARGRLNQGMTEQLQSMYIAEKGNDRELGTLLDSLQRGVQATLIGELKPKMLRQPAPAFTLKDINGNTVSLSDYAGKIVVLDLWATWCRPCIASFPAMQLMVEKHPEVAFLFIAVEEPGPNPLSRVQNFQKKWNYPFTILMDEPVAKGSERFKIVSSYQPNGIPAKYIIDGKGILRFRTSGFDTDMELINELEAMFTLINNL